MIVGLSRRVQARARVSGLAIFVSMAATACRETAPDFDPLQYLAVGTDTQTEAMVEERAFRTRGFAIVSRVDGREFVALGARSPREGASSVRILTSRGIAMGVDAPVRDRPTWRSVALVERASGRDLDGDGDPEVLLSIDDSMRPSPCLVVVRVRSAGDAFEVPLDARAYGPRACPEDVVDLDRDGTIQLLVGYRPWIVAGAPIPVMPIAFEGHDGQWGQASEGTARDLAGLVIADRTEAFLQAKSRGETAEALRLALELFWLEGSRATPRAERDAALDAALAGLALDERMEALVTMARTSASE